MYIADLINNRIRKVTVSTGIIITIAGTGTYGYSGNGGAATSAALAYPNGIAFDSSGTHHFINFNIYPSDLNVFSFLCLLIPSR